MPVVGREIERQVALTKFGKLIRKRTLVKMYLKLSCGHLVYRDNTTLASRYKKAFCHICYESEEERLAKQ